MAFVVLFTTMSFTVDMHYCGDTLMDFSISHKDATCGMEKREDPMSCESGMTEESCCTDAQMVLEGQDDLKHSFHSLSFDQQVFVASFIYAYISLLDGTESKAVPFDDYAPPFLKRDVLVLHQTFLI
ncbi:hypothetical protein RQM65_00425 [Pricia sp. S334]|uniref:Uncharacterized protein n=2 Tax=Pricia mediterranea TaxID=3076079 RepID=A0ABU3L1Y9_9FLAO|nr:hypothetical protein [Pricia sp. S334]MDT7827127.1 hypothetical protein [Pricia sp. S334]